MTAPDANELHTQAIARLQSGDLDRAIRLFEQTVKINSSIPEFHNNLGNALIRANRLEEAIAAFRRAVSLRPDYAKAQSNLGGALKKAGALYAARDAYASAIAADPNLAEAHWNLGLLLLAQGDYLRGFQEYDYRLRLPQLAEATPPNAEPRWDGSDLNGKTILLLPEQGFGDAVQFARYVPLVARRGGKVILQTRKELVRLFQSLEGITQLIPHGDPLPHCDVYCPLMSLPVPFQTTIDTVPATVPYLSAPAALVQHFKSRLPNPARMKVGLTWAGDPKHKNDNKRSIPPATFAPLFEIPGIDFYSLQKSVNAHGAGDPTIIDWTTDLEDFAATAALIKNLDLIITVDTAVAHVAGALAKPVWLLLRHASDWRWLLDRADSPWYPTMRLFRQQTDGDWTTVLSRVTTQLKELSHGQNF